MVSVCIYGTVFNNANTVEDSVKSVWSPDYDIVIVDNYSRDGTWEKLQELKKEYNLKLYRLKSSRGKGRAYALEQCPENSITAYFDLDLMYNQNYHKVIGWSISRPNNIVFGPFFLIAKKEIIINKGSWRDLNVGEDTELITRIGFDYYVPVIAAKNLYKTSVDREFRYSKGVKYCIRKLRNIIDYMRGHGYNFHDIINKYKYKNYGKFVMIEASIVYSIAKLKGIYRYDKLSNNEIVLIHNSLEKLINPKDIGICDKYLIYQLPLIYSYMKTNVSEKLHNKLGNMLLYKCDDGLYRYVKNEEALKLALEQSNSPEVECIEEYLV